MKIISKKGVSGLVELMLTVILWSGFTIWLTIPWSLTRLIPIFKPFQEFNTTYRFFITAILYITGIPSLCIVYEIRQCFKSVNDNNPFIYRNVKSLNRIGYLSFFIAICYIIKIFIYPTILTIVISMIFVIAGFFGIVLAEVFRLATVTKEENDLTI